jgi:hypothetical protein
MDPEALTDADKRHSLSVGGHPTPENWDTLDGFKIMLDVEISTFFTDSEDTSSGK